MGQDLVDIAIVGDTIAAIGEKLPYNGEEIDGKGNALIPGLIDHHIHLLATAARMNSLNLSSARGSDALAVMLREKADTLEAGKWIRAVDYDERTAGILGRAELDRLADKHPLRLQDRTGALWMLNSLAVKALGPPPYPECVECDENGNPTGRIWRGDDWLRLKLGTEPPSLAELGKSLARVGITGVTDTGAHNGPSEAAILAQAVADGSLPQRLTLMGTEDLPPSYFYKIGPVKLHFDEHALPDMDLLVSRITKTREGGRSVAAHCVALGELLYYLAALEASGGAEPGDRVEHGGMIPESLIADIARAGLTVVTQPGFIHERGDRYIAEVDPRDRANLYRLRSLIDAGVPVASGSDAPYASFDPWVAIKAARDRQTASGHYIGANEAISTLRALNLYLSDAEHPGGPSRSVAVGARADLVLLHCTLEEMLDEPDSSAVAKTLVGGKLAAG